MMCRWAQELLGYHFSCLHRAARMMIDVDGLSSQFGTAIAQNFCIAALLHQVDITNRPKAYNSGIGTTKNVAQHDPSFIIPDAHVPISTSDAIVSAATTSIPISVNTITTTYIPITVPVTPPLCSVPILLCHSPPVDIGDMSLENDGSDLSSTLQVASNSFFSLVVS